MLTFFEALLLGHLAGDYIAQNNWMAQRKSAHLFPCVVHCLIYTAAVIAFTHSFFTSAMLPWWACIVFLSHFPVDRWSLADKWLRLIRGRSLVVYLEHGHEEIPADKNSSEWSNYWSLRGGFTALVYAATDNTFHLLLMLAGARWLGKA